MNYVYKGRTDVAIATKENLLELNQALLALKLQGKNDSSMIKSIIDHLEVKGFIRLHLKHLSAFRSVLAGSIGEQLNTYINNTTV